MLPKFLALALAPLAIGLLYFHCVAPAMQSAAAALDAATLQSAPR